MSIKKDLESISKDNGDIKNDLEIIHQKIKSLPQDKQDELFKWVRKCMQKDRERINLVINN